MEKMAEQNNVNAARVLANLLWSRDAQLLEDLSAADPKTLQGRPEVKALREEVTRAIANAPVYRLKIYDRHGDTIFSTDPAQIGENESDDEGFEQASHGAVLSELARANTFSLTESMIVDRDLLSSYVPIYRGGTGTEIVGVFEVYDDVTIFLRDINRGIASQVALVLLTTGAVYLVLIWYVRRGDHLLRAEHARSLSLVQSVARAEAASKAKSQFLANMSHELRTPLNSVIGFAEILSAEGFGPLGDTRYLGYAKEIGDGGRNLLTIINNTLDLSKIELGTADVALRPVDPGQVVGSAVHQLARQVQDSGVAVEVETDPATPPLQSDEAKLRQILFNVISNALKFTPAGGRVDVALRAQGGRAEQRVGDSGQGNAPEAQPHLVDMFKQADPSARRQGGLGIGLALVRNLVRGHGGQVRAESDGPGRGACFTVCLPLAGQASLLVEDANHHATAHLRGRQALVVDDDAQALDLLRLLLELEGASVRCATDGAAALALAEQQAPDFVLTDMALPGLDGLQLLQALRQRPALKALPVVALTGVGRPADARRAIAAGFAAHLRKPVTLSKLLATLREVLPP
jgi:signal transduction histidine kinase